MVVAMLRGSEPIYDSLKRRTFQEEEASAAKASGLQRLQAARSTQSLTEPPWAVAFPTSFTPTAVFSPAFSVYLTDTLLPSAIPSPTSLPPFMVVLSVQLIVCSVPSAVLTTMVFESLSIDFTTPLTI